MDEFTPYGDDFLESLSKLCKFLKICIEMNLSLNLEKCHFFMNSRIVLGHFLSKGCRFPLIRFPHKQKDVWSFLGLVGYYRRFIKDFSKIASPLFGLLTKDLDFCWTYHC